MIDTSLFVVDIPAGTYANGDLIEMTLKAGPANVRQGYGDAYLKQIMSGTLIEVSGSAARFEVEVRNSNLIDPIINSPSVLYGAVGLAEESTGVQSGHNLKLDAMSTWTVYARCIYGATTTVAATLYAAIDVDYPQVASVMDPSKEDGTPCSIVGDYAVSVDALGSAASAAWDVFNVDIFKPANRYLLTKMSITPSGTTDAFVGFVAFANGASMQGLSRIVPITSTPSAIQKSIEYAAPQVKGPMDVKFMLFDANGATTDTLRFVSDYVKRSI